MTGKQFAAYETMKSFLNIKYYDTEEIAINIIKSYNASQDLTHEQYLELIQQARDVYNPYVPPVDEPTVIPEVI